MSGTQLRAARTRRGLKQQELADRLGLSQGYVSLLERNRRVVPRRLAQKLASVLQLPATSLPVGDTEPLEPERATRVLGTLGYEGFKYLRRGRRLNPAELVLRILRGDNVDARVVKALVWLLVQYPDLEWDWVVRMAKQNDLQNRLGFLVSLARGFAEVHDPKATPALRHWEQALEKSRLQKTATFGPLTDAEQTWLQTHSSAEAHHWNVLSTLSVDALQYAV